MRELKERILGKTGLKVRTLGFGGIPIQRVGEEEAIKVIRRCYELGINYYDTARGYTNSEEKIGIALEDVREKVYYATKSHAKTSEGILKEFEISAKNLRTDYIDVYQLHNVGNKELWNQIQAEGGPLEALYELKEQEKIKNISVTTHSPDLGLELVKSSHFSTIMIPYNYLTTKPAESLLPLCKKLNVGTIIMKPFGGGAFSNANTALKYVYNNTDADIAIPGVATVEEVEENCKIWQGDLTLSKEELELIEKDRQTLGDQFCRGCDYCQPCPQDVPISTILRTEQFLQRTGWSERTVKRIREVKEKLDTCINCGTCESRCPYNLPIQELLTKTMENLWNQLEKQTLSNH